MAGVIGLVVARGGSKGIPGKNLRPLDGHPLVGWAVRASTRCDAVDRVVISTDDADIARAARAYGVDDVIERPAELASDTAVAIDVIRHAADRLDATQPGWDALCLLQPTCPLRLPGDVADTIAALDADPMASSACSLAEVQDAHPARLRRIESGVVRQFLDKGGDHEGLQRQDHATAYRRNGAVYVVRRDALRKHGSLYGPRVVPHVMPEHRSVNIDTPLDLLLAQGVITHAADSPWADDAQAWRSMMA